MRLLVNIRGCNGSGKSTIPMSMMDDPEMFVVYKNIPGRKKPLGIATVFPTYGWVALGTYFNKTGGMDCLPNNKVIQKTIWYVLNKYPEYDIIMEGVIASTISSTYIQLFEEIQNQYEDIKVVIVSFKTPVEVCLKRIYERNGGKPIKENAVESKWSMVQRASVKFKNAGFRVIRVDNSKVSKENMTRKFFAAMKEEKKGVE